MSFPGRYTQRAWHLVDASSQTVGRLANSIAPLLKGKHKPTYRPNADCGDYVVIINAEKVNFTANKWKTKLYRWHTGYPGGLKQRRAEEMLEKKPEDVLKKAIIGMLSRNNLRHGFVEPRLKIYAGGVHPHTSQLPEGVEALEKVPRKRVGDYHYGFKDGKYSVEGTYQEIFNGEVKDVTTEK
mmetsp:Transcript_6875/g.7952  ORF Transcript_6875/g.7952 Transcript_6875/m.7952 type:complete len:183 (-) Transcript_6875:166-714(-)|eukprot:CAMPEP_0198252090 /NCGR_PEP_ID=MMETSP1447-20131203/2692_1 /TAXON_ID=420782 /ORGANISM="Chaetoceros dichaeta, Strain CCMP1751" /LENGTH=182 /DNA_ID=CAMNT_0043937251 /DNA_START=170 /DNA_END=718 /DNA_ORIENTATION=+